VGQLQTDIGIQPVGRDRVENLVIQSRAVARLIWIRNVFAKIVDADAHAGPVDGLGYTHSIGDFRTRNEATGNTLSNG
jgi:hypothetical protein